MKYTIRTELDDEHELTSINEIEWAVNRLPSEPGSFLCIEPEAPIDGINYLQACYIQKTKGLFKKTVVASYYEVEVQVEKPNGDLYQYLHDTEDWDDALNIICGFFENQAVPTLAEWRSELFYKSEQ